MRGFVPLFSPVSGFFVFYLLLFCYDSNTDVAFQIHYHCCFSTFPKWHHDETEHHASISLIITFSKETDRFQIYVDDGKYYLYMARLVSWSFFLSLFFSLLSFFISFFIFSPFFQHNSLGAFQVTENGTECSELCALLSGTVLFICTDAPFVKKWKKQAGECRSEYFLFCALSLTKQTDYRPPLYLKYFNIFGQVHFAMAFDNFYCTTR